MAALRIRTAEGDSPAFALDALGFVVPARAGDGVDVPDRALQRRCIDDETLRAAVASATLVLVDSVTGDVPLASAIAYLDAFLVPRGVVRVLPIHVSFRQEAAGVITADYGGVSGASWVTVASFLVPGTSSEALARWSVVASRAGTDGAGSARLYDVTNSNVLATLSWSTVGKGLYSTVEFSDVSAAEAIVELQVNDTGSDSRLHSSSLV